MWNLRRGVKNNFKVLIEIQEEEIAINWNWEDFDLVVVFGIKFWIQ